MLRAGLGMGWLVAVVLASPGVAGAFTTPPLVVDGTVDPQPAPPAAVPQVGVSAAGDVVAAWRDAGGTAAPVKLLLWRAGAPTPEVTVAGLGTDPSVAMAPDGTAVAVWAGSDGGMRIARRVPGGSFGAPAVQAPEPPPSSQPSQWRRPAVAIRDDRSATVAAISCLFYGSHHANQGNAFEVSPSGEITGPVFLGTDWSSSLCDENAAMRISVASGGRAVLTQCHSGACWLATRSATGANWVVGRPNDEPSGIGGYPALPQALAGGTFAVAYTQHQPAPRVVEASVGTTATTKTQPFFAGSDAHSDVGSIAALGSGDAVVAWRTFDGGGTEPRIVVRSLFGSATWGDPVTAVDKTFAAGSDPQIATWPDGSGLLGFVAQPAVDSVPALALRRRALGGALTAVPLPGTGRAVTALRVALGGDGAAPLGAVGTYETPEGGEPQVVLRRIDGVAPSLSLAAPASAAAGVAATFTATATDTSAPVRVRWDFGDGVTAEGTAVQHAFAAAGSHTVTATATDAAGNVRTATASLQVAPAPNVPTPDVLAPAIGRARLTPSRFRVGRANTALSAQRRAPAGSRLRLTLSEAATLRIVVQRERRGRRVGKRCSLRARRGRRCVRWSTVRALTRQLGAGTADIRFTGRFRGRALARGRHRLAMTATDAAGNRSRATTVRFTIVR